MATYKDILKENENQNWLKGSLALRITKAGLRNLVEGDSFRVQQKIHSSIIQTGNLAPGTSCSLCFTENLMQCRTKGLCSIQQNCKYHDSALKMCRPCPSQICDDFRDEICAVHRYGGPSWKNTKADQWCTNHWQVAKCFMPPDGYQDVSSFDETDFNGIISFMINCTEIQRSLSFNIANQPNQPNILTKVRQIGRNLRHSPELKVTDTDLADYFATLNTLLTDATYLASDSYAQQAVVKLKQLQNDTLPISSEDVRELLEEAKAVIEAGKHELLQYVDTSKQEIQDMLSKGRKAVATGKRKIEETVSEGKTAIASGKRLVDETVFKGKTAIETGTRQIEEVVFEGKTGIATGKLEIEEMTSQALQRIRDVSTMSNAEQKKELQQRLAKFYQKHLNSAPISPLLSNKDERLDTMYVPPKVVEKDHKKVGAVNKEKGTPVTAYRQLFCTKGKFSKNVFIVGEAGMGKTSCAAMCALKWAKQFRATSTINEHNRNVSHQTSFEYLKSEMLYFDSDLNDVLFSKSKQDDNFQDDTFFKEIEFLFHFTLRDCGDFCNLTDMIRDKLISKLYPKDMMAAALTTMHSVLSHNTCVIIADGLDEWTHPNQTYCSCSEEDKVIPYLSPAIDATVLITSRPWKLSQQRVKDTNIDKYLNIEGTADMKLLIHNMLSSLNETVTEKKTLLDFLMFVDTMKLARLLSVPIISMFLVCLWFDGMHESFSVCGIYAYTIEMMLRRKTLPEPIVAQSNIPSPCCFQHTEYIQKYYSIVMEMAELAYTTLFLNDKTSSLVFTKADFLAQENLMIVLKSGILQETKTASLIRKSSSYSFIHKTVQEFLAAIYMSYHPKEFYRVFKSSYEKNDYMADVSQVFIFMCGLNAKLANEMSAMISNSMLLDDENFWSDTGVNAIQSTIISGYKEAQASKVLNIQLSLFTFEYIYTSETAILDNLLWINKSSVRHISITNSSISQAKLQEVFSSSSDTLTRVELFSQHGKYDLSACKRLKQILISGTETTDIVLDSKPLTSLCLSCVSETVEKRIFHSLKHGSETLKNFVMESITNISLLCQSVSSLTHLHRLSIIDMDFSDHALIIPAFFTTVELEEVTLTARSLMGLVKWLENCPEGARCTLDKYYAAENTVGKEVYQYIQTRKRLNIKTKGETQIIERKKCKRKRTKCIVS